MKFLESLNVSEITDLIQEMSLTSEMTNGNELLGFFRNRIP